METRLTDGLLRQGDVLIVKIDELPEGLADITPETGRVVLHVGEAAHHYHAFYDGKTQIFAPKGAKRPTHLRVVETAFLRHDEHSPAAVPPGIYRLPVQTEHTDEDEPRVVAD